MPAPEALDPVVARELEALDAALAGRTDDPVLADVVAAVHEDRPRPSAEWAAILDARVAGGLLRERPRRRPSWSAWLPAGLVVAATALVALVIALPALDGGGERPELSGAGGGGGGGAASEAMDDGAQSGSAGRDAPSDAAGGGGESRSVVPPGPVPAPPADGRGDRARERQVERSATLVLAAPSAEVPGVADRILRTADAAGGFVLRSSVRSDVAGGGGTFELRVPADRLGRTLADLSRLAHVRERTQDAQDITAEGVAARERLDEARADRRALLRRLGRASTDAQANRLRAQARAAARRIAAARRDARRVANRAAFSTVLVTLVPDDAAGGGAGTGDRWTPGDALRDAGRVLEVVAGVLLVALAVAVPALLLVGGPALLWRHGARRRRDRALDAV